jgi:hypothetical protein
LIIILLLQRVHCVTVTRSQQQHMTACTRNHAGNSERHAALCFDHVLLPPPLLLLLLLMLLQVPQGCGACQCQPALKGVTRSTPAGRIIIILKYDQDWKSSM